MAKVYCKYKRVIEEFMDECEKIIICGDMNARVGEEQGCLDIDDQISEARIRKSKDKTLNLKGKKLLKLCEKFCLIVMNGRSTGDEEGNLTFVGGGPGFTGSVIDLVLCVDTRVKIFSEKLFNFQS